MIKSIGMGLGHPSFSAMPSQSIISFELLFAHNEVKREQLDLNIVPSFIFQHLVLLRGFPCGSVVKNSPAMQETWVPPLVGKIPWKRKWQSTPVFLPRKFHRQRSLVGYSTWGCRRVRHDLATKQQHQNSNKNFYTDKFENID